MRLEVVDLRLVRDPEIALEKIDPYHKGVRLSRLVASHARQHPSIAFERRLPEIGIYDDARQLDAEFLHPIECRGHVAECSR